MDLYDWLRKRKKETRFFQQKFNHKDFAKELGIHPIYLSDIINGRKFPSLELMQKIEILTNGAVKKDDFFTSRKQMLLGILEELEDIESKMK